MFCKNCGAQIEDNIKFCPNCGELASNEYDFCQSCGISVVENPIDEHPTTVPADKMKLPKNVIMLVGIGVAILIFVISLLSNGGGKSENSYALYLKDNEIYFTDLEKDSKSWQLSSRLVDTDDIDNLSLAVSGYSLGRYTYMSENGKYLFFPDRVSETVNLYYREVDKPDEDAIKIDSNVFAYTVNTSATLVTYLKGEEFNLYQYSINDESKYKIASDVSSFEVSDDGKKIYYTNSENSIYLKYANKEKEKIANDVSSLEYITEDFTTVYYIKDGSLYMQVEGKDKVKVASDVYEVIKIYDSGEIYYLTGKDEEISLMDYINDDMKTSDASIVKPSNPNYPKSPNYPFWWDYDTDDEYEAAYSAYEEAYIDWQAECDRIETKYNADLKKYKAKVSRDELRADLERETFEQSSHSLCFYDGTEKVVITDTFAGGSFDCICASEVPVIIYEVYNQSNIEKVKFSEVKSINDIYDMVEKALFSSTDRYITVNSTATIVEQKKEATSFRINSSGTVIYYIDNITNERDYGELYRISITHGVVGKAEIYDSDVYSPSLLFVSDSELQYFKDYEDYKGDLYINKNRIDSDIGYNFGEGYFDHKKYFYLTDYDNCHGTLKFYNGKESVRIADDVYDFCVTPDGNVLYLYDYSTNYYNGTLYEWNNGKSTKIDDDVVGIIPFFYDKYMGDYYHW